LRGFGQAHPFFPSVKLNQFLCYRFQRQNRQAAEQLQELQSLELSSDTVPVVSLLQNTSEDQVKDPALRIDVSDQGMPMLFDILQRALDLGEEEFARSLIDRLSSACRSRHLQTLGNLFYDYGYLDEAEYYLRLQASGQTAHSEAFFKLAEIRRQQKDFLEAGCLYRQALGIDPDQPGYYLRMADLYREMRLDVLSQAAECHPNAPGLQPLLEAGQ
jgi:tetratricopeptide (TPR) repeat protein